ncbi:hypothetical protein IL306_000227 [Fusarium sp. DS 682]|nr:hypothetical protein IL306_000227 [Fusarium sp. DS 682]
MSLFARISMSSHRSGGGSHRRHKKHQSSAPDASRPPSPAQILEETQQMLRELQAQSESYTSRYDYHVREARRLQIMMQSASEERALLSGSAAAVHATRQGRMVDHAEMEARREQLDSEIANLERSIQHYQNASASMQRLWQSVETEIRRLQEEIVALRSPLA